VVHIDHGNTALGRDRLEHVVAQLNLFGAIGGRGEVEQEIRAGLDALLHGVTRIEALRPEMLVVPDILANRDAHAETAELMDAYGAARLEIARLVKDIVEGQEDLGVIKHYAAAHKQRRGVGDGLPLLCARGAYVAHQGGNGGQLPGQPKQLSL
jgi:hypothetical protein